MKKQLYILLLSVIIHTSCSKNKEVKNDTVNNVIKSEFQKILDSNTISGTVLIFDTQKNTFYSNNFEEAKRGTLPASTFKIPNSIIGLETGILKDETSIFKWNGEQHYLDAWEKDLTLKEAFRASCVPCYQEMARKIGAKRMQKNLQNLTFGIMDVNDETIDNFWLTGNSKVSPFEQIDFLQRLYNEKLPIKEATSKTIKSILKIKTTNNYTLSGKTGLAVGIKPEIGWFVGYIETNGKVLYFATRISPSNDMKMNDFIPLRQKVTEQALKKIL